MNKSASKGAVIRFSQLFGKTLRQAPAGAETASHMLMLKAGITLPEYMLHPSNPDDTGVWEDQHQQMHQDMDALLGINGFDLTNVNFENEAYLAGWIQLHFNEHYQAANILGIG